MSDLFAHIAIEDARVEPLGVKEAIAMALEHLGGVRVLEVQLQEPEQTRMAGGAFAPSKPRPRPGPKSSPPPPPPGGQAPARSSRRPQTAMECCGSCGHFCLAQGWDLGHKFYWGTCGRTGQLVGDLKERCPDWTRLGG